MKSERVLTKKLKGSDVAKTAAIVFGAAAVGATLAYFLDAESGKKRRAMVIDKSSQLSKGAIDMTMTQFNGLSSVVTGVVASGLAYIKDNFGINLGSLESSSEVDDSAANDGVQPRLTGAVPSRKETGKTAFRETEAVPYQEQ